MRQASAMPYRAPDIWWFLATKNFMLITQPVILGYPRLTNEEAVRHIFNGVVGECETVISMLANSNLKDVC